MEISRDTDSQKSSKNEICLRLESVSKNFAGLEAVSQINLEVHEGERRAIIGPNGAGKTTLFNLIGGQLSPTRGRIFLFGREITKIPDHLRAHLGISRTFQITNLFPQLTVFDNLILAAQALEKTKFALFRPITRFNHLYRKVDEILLKVGMTEKREDVIKNLSYGEQRQIEIAMALLGEPCLLLLDEPTAGLAPAESSVMVSMLKNLDKTITILIIEHDMDVAFQIADGITVLNFGKVVAEGSKEEIRTNSTVQEIYLRVE
jgi:branched-chain amino acid transport system ATP-binding protein